MARRTVGLMMVGLALAGSGCAVMRQATSRAVASSVDEILAALESQPDPETARQGLPTFLLALDGMIEGDPDDRDQLRTGALAYATYCQSFLIDETDRERAARMYDRAREYGLRCLATRPFFAAALEAPVAEFEAVMPRFGPADVPDLYAAAAAWLGWILTHSESMKAVADMPRALALMDRVLALDDTHADGAPHLFYGIFYAARPRGAGQDIDRARRHFDRAAEISGPGNLAIDLAYGEFIGKATLDEAVFTERLQRVLDADLSRWPRRRLMNTIARQRARWLMDHKDELL